MAAIVPGPSEATVVADASAIIAALDAAHPHHADALIAFGNDPWIVHAMQVAEVLVHPARESAEQAKRVLDGLVDAGAIIEYFLDPIGVALVRAQTRLKMPDAIALWTSRVHNADLITFDAELARHATQGG